jgi:hypothetical protein
MDAEVLLVAKVNRRQETAAGNVSVGRQKCRSSDDIVRRSGHGRQAESVAGIGWWPMTISRSLINCVGPRVLVNLSTSISSVGRYSVISKFIKLWTARTSAVRNYAELIYWRYKVSSDQKCSPVHFKESEAIWCSSLNNELRRSKRQLNSRQ